MHFVIVVDALGLMAFEPGDGGEVIGGIVGGLCGSKLGVFDEGVEWGFFVEGNHVGLPVRGGSSQSQ